MCGFVGTLVFDGSDFRVSDAYLTRMRETMRHRGPDGAGNWISADGRIGLGHRRLAIIDLSPAAAQPMATDDGLQIVFNGEIYNHAGLRAELAHACDFRWRTDHSDTEVILAAFRRWGIRCLDRFRGMFAFALWDGRRHELWLVRDRIGIKPLYFSVHDGRITFASEIKALLADPQQRREVQEEALYDYLSFLTTPGPQTLFKGIQKLPAGCLLHVSHDGSVRQERWWEVWDHTRPLVDAGEDEIAERVLAELRTAVGLRKVSDVPVGVFLSGGIDSSTNAALFSEGEARPAKTFTIGYEGEFQSYRNEIEFARTMAKRLNAEHHVKLLTLDDLLAFVPEMVRLQDEPIADPVCVPVYYVSRLARDSGVIVCQVGEGADELFCGYPQWMTLLRLQKLADAPVPRAAGIPALALLRLARRDEGETYEWLRRRTTGTPLFWGGAEAFTEREKRKLLAHDVRRRLVGLTSWEAIAPIHRRFVAKAWDRSHLNWMTFVDLNLRLPELLLMRVDKMSMAAGVEARVPFLDHELVTLALGIPATLKTKDGVLKRVLKRSVRGVIPDELIDRPKQGFGVPVHEWLLGALGPIVERALIEFSRKSGILEERAVRALLARPGGPGPKAWYLYNLAMWWNAYLQ